MAHFCAGRRRWYGEAIEVRMPNHDLCELIDGRIMPMRPTNPEHGRIEATIGAVLDRREE